MRGGGRAKGSEGFCATRRWDSGWGMQGASIIHVSLPEYNRLSAASAARCCVSAAGEEDNEVDFDRAQEKARRFADWADGVPKGAGNTKRI